MNCYNFCNAKMLVQLGKNVVHLFIYLFIVVHRATVERIEWNILNKQNDCSTLKGVTYNNTRQHTTHNGTKKLNHSDNNDGLISFPEKTEVLQ